MSEHRDTHSVGEVAMELAGYSVGLGILTMALFPFSVVGLVLFVIAPIAVLIAPLVLVPVLVLLLAAPFILVFRGARSLMARRPGRDDRPRRRAPDDSSSVSPPECATSLPTDPTLRSDACSAG